MYRLIASVYMDHHRRCFFKAFGREQRIRWLSQNYPPFLSITPISPTIVCFDLLLMINKLLNFSVIQFVLLCSFLVVSLISNQIFLTDARVLLKTTTDWSEERETSPFLLFHHPIPLNWLPSHLYYIKSIVSFLFPSTFSNDTQSHKRNNFEFSRNVSLFFLILNSS